MMETLRESRRLRHWEAALMAGVAIALLSGLWLDGEQAALADKVLRLHVIANSDTQADQALKLEVRDRILTEAGDLLEGSGSVEEAAQVLQAALPELEAAGEAAVRAAGCDYSVTASLEEDVWFPTKEYSDFALPQGSYTALRVVIGEGAGQNWWCVVFPPLCLTAAETEAAFEQLDEPTRSVIAEDEGSVCFKFRILELWGELAHFLGLD